MCIKHVNVCCHCGDVMEPDCVSCHFHLLLSRVALSQDPPTEEPPHSECPYLRKDLRPMLRGCVNSDSCPSWLWSVSGGLGESGDEEEEELSEEELERTREMYEGYKREFAEHHYTRRPPPARKNFGDFLEVALEDMSDMESDRYGSSDDELSLEDYDEEDGLVLENGSPGSLSDYTKPSSTPPGVGVNPELPPPENTAPNKHAQGLESKPPTAEGLAKEYRDLIAPIRAWFFPNDSDPDAEVSQ